MNLAELPPNLSIRASVFENAESVRFQYNGLLDFQIDSLLPYALFGDTEGNYASRIFLNTQHRIVVTPFSEDNAEGGQGTPFELNFTVLN